MDPIFHYLRRGRLCGCTIYACFSRQNSCLISPEQRDKVVDGCVVAFQDLVKVMRSFE